jgi:hypothetical protein
MLSTQHLISGENVVQLLLKPLVAELLIEIVIRDSR